LSSNPSAFDHREVAYLSQVISATGMAMDQQKVQAVLDWPPSHTVCAVRTFLGLMGYYRRFIQDYGTIVVPLTKLLHKDTFKWGPEATTVISTLQRALTIAPVLQLPDFDRAFFVECDASGVGVGPVLH
jgi:hypothetical protein